MCGLAFVATKKDKHTGKRVYDLYQKQRARGTDGYGYIAIQDGKVVDLKRFLYEDSMKKSLLNEKSEMILFHHRYPTSTPNTLGTTHPMFVSNDELEYDYLVMHNGVISNHDDMHKKHEELGYKYTTEYEEETFVKYKHNQTTEFLEYGKEKYNDSESLAIEIARYFEAKDTSISAVGAAAVLGVVLEKGTNKVVDVFYGQNYGRSLARQDRKGWILIASEGPGKEVDAMKFFHIDPVTFKTQESEMDMDRGYRQTAGYGYRGYQVNEPPEKKALPATVDRTTNIYGLVNAMYTYSEAIDSGAPMDEFELQASQLIDGKYQTIYVPKIFLGDNENNRPMFSEAYHYEDVPVVEPDKDQELLEELAMKYARKEYERERIAELYQEDSLDKETYNGRDANLELELQTLEEDMSALGIDMQVVEETVATAQEFVDYEYSERT